MMRPAIARFRDRSRRQSLRQGARGSAILEFAITIPLLVVFVVGIYDFSGAFNQKQKIEQAAQEGAILAAAGPSSDIYSGNANPASLQPVVAGVFNSLAAAGVLPLANQAPCSLVPAPTPVVGTNNPLSWVYTFTQCSNTNDSLVITINRGWAATSGSPSAVGSVVTVNYPYHWRFNSVIQLLIPGATYAAVTQVQEAATVQNQM